MSSKHILMTGVASGIGKQMLSLCHDQKMNIIGVVRKEDQKVRIEQQYDASTKVILSDLSDKVQVDHLCDQIRGNSFDYVLLNAGIAEVGTFHELSKESIEVTMQVNITSNMSIVHALLPKALENKTKFVFVSSLVANMPGGNYASYAASKAALTHFYRCLKKEYPSLDFLCIEIGAVDTPMHEKSGNKVENKKLFKSKDDIAKKLYHAMLHKTGIQTLSLDWTIIRHIVRLIG